MKKDNFLVRMGVIFAIIFAAFCLWQYPGLITGKLTKAEIDNYIAVTDKNLPFPADVDKADTLARVRKWAEADDGKPVYMLNLMRYNAKNELISGTPAFNGTPFEANKHYEDEALKLLIKQGGAGGSFASETEGQNLITIGKDAALDNWSRVLVIRYPSRRHFLELLSDPHYAPIEPYKMMALRLLLVPTSGDLVIPDYRLILGAALLVIFFAVGWSRATRTAQ